MGRGGHSPPRVGPSRPSMRSRNLRESPAAPTLPFISHVLCWSLVLFSSLTSSPPQIPPHPGWLYISSTQATHPVIKLVTFELLPSIIFNSRVPGNNTKMSKSLSLPWSLKIPHQTTQGKPKQITSNAHHTCPMTWVIEKNSRNRLPP